MAFTTEPSDVHTLWGGTQRMYEFGNGCGASVVRHPYSYGSDSGLWELAVLDADGGLVYDTPITAGVLGYLTEDEVEAALREIRKLPGA